MLILGLVVLLVFGPKRLPEMGRSLGHGMREFKDAVTGNEEAPPRTEVPPRAPSSTKPSETERVSS